MINFQKKKYEIIKLKSCLNLETKTEIVENIKLKSWLNLETENETCENINAKVDGI